jgi:hypothetical protein
MKPRGIIRKLAQAWQVLIRGTATSEWSKIVCMFTVLRPTFALSLPYLLPFQVNGRNAQALWMGMERKKKEKRNEKGGHVCFCRGR